MSEMRPIPCGHTLLKASAANATPSFEKKGFNLVSKKIKNADKTIRVTKSYAQAQHQAQNMLSFLYVNF